LKMDPREQQLEVAFEINKLLNCGLDKETLSICMGLLETGVNPEALADVIKEVRREKERAVGEKTTGTQQLEERKPSN